jgi:FkbM family methyltransferase
MKNSDRLRLLFRAIAGDDNARSLLRWRLLRLDRLLFEHRLQRDELVYDVGGYRGDWAWGMLGRYSCEYHVFEPHPEAFRKLSERFAGHADVTLHEFALGGANGCASLSSAAEGSSIVSHRSDDSIQVRLVDICQHLSNQGRQVALMKLNIEGSEYGLLEKLLQSEMRHRVQSMLIQFHLQGPDSLARYASIAASLAETHRLSWRYPFLWELWTPQGVSLSRKERMLPNARLI